MTNKYSAIFYILSGVILLAALGLLFLRQPFIDYYREKSGVTKTEVVITKLPPADTLINTEILNGKILGSLSNQVKVFSFDEVCGSSVSAPASCRVGNNNPFLDK